MDEQRMALSNAAYPQATLEPTFVVGSDFQIPVRLALTVWNQISVVWNSPADTCRRPRPALTSHAQHQLAKPTGCVAPPRSAAGSLLAASVRCRDRALSSECPMSVSANAANPWPVRAAYVAAAIFIGRIGHHQHPH